MPKALSVTWENFKGNNIFLIMADISVRLSSPVHNCAARWAMGLLARNPALVSGFLATTGTDAFPTAASTWTATARASTSSALAAAPATTTLS
jgi:hypothetical protein